MAEIPHELLIEILSSLPAKSIFRFRCVRKSWYNLIFNSNFIQMHLSRAIHGDERDLVATKSEHITKQLNYTIESDHESLNRSGLGKFTFSINRINWIDGHRVFKDPFGEHIDFDGSSTLLGSCNGVVCLVKKNKVCLLNPCTREYKIVRFDIEVDFFREAAHGFGYDAINDDYQLVQIVYDVDEDESQVDVFSLNNNSINKISEFPYRICSREGGFGKQSGVFLNGAIYWVAWRKYEHVEQVIAFELGVNEVREIPRPDSVSEDANFDDKYHYSRACLTVGVIGGLLALLTISDNYVDIWMLMNDANDLWCQVFSIESSISDGSLRMSPLYFTKNGEVVFRNGKNLVMYDLEEGTKRYLNLHGIPDLSQMDRLITHCPTLVSLQSDTYIDTVIGVEAEE